ncbi:MAG TPA: hypothetical protein VN181_14580 [Thermoanaerobaculia bacterium]|nr:hypothetical protein [Thermoanaerobaculia bacterium]
MRHLSALTAVALLALPLAADDAKAKAETKPAPKAEAKATTGTAQPAAAANDSPMVAAAKRANRLGKNPKFIITSENLVTSGGHFTTTEQQRDISSVTPPLPTAADLEKKRSDEARAKFMKEKAETDRQHAEQAKQDRLRRANEAAEAAADAYDTEDPAQAEQMAEEAAKKLQEQKPPRR